MTKNKAENVNSLGKQCWITEVNNLQNLKTQVLCVLPGAGQGMGMLGSHVEFKCDNIDSGAICCPLTASTGSSVQIEAYNPQDWSRLEER